MCVSLILSFIPLKTGSPISKLVLLKLADNADARGVCFPSLSYLAQYCEVSVRTVKRHINELEKQGFVKRIKRFDGSGRQRSNLYQLRLPSESACHIEQNDLESADQEAIVQGKAQHKAQAEFNTALPQSYECDTLQSVTMTATESDPMAHIISQKEHKTGLKTDQSAQSAKKNSAQSSQQPQSQEQAQDEAVIHLLTKEGSAPVYQEFYNILERTYPKLDVQQELLAMQAWLYVNPEKRKPFEHIGHFVNGWLRRSAQAKAKQGGSLAVAQVKKKPKSPKASKQKQGLNPDKRNAVENDIPTRTETAQATPVTQALAEYHAKNRVNPFEARIQALIQSRTPESS